MWSGQVSTRAATTKYVPMRFLTGLKPELSEAGGPARSHWQLTSPARVRSSDLVRPVRLTSVGLEILHIGDIEEILLP